MPPKRCSDRKLFENPMLWPLDEATLKNRELFYNSNKQLTSETLFQSENDSVIKTIKNIDVTFLYIDFTDAQAMMKPGNLDDISTLTFYQLDTIIITLNNSMTQRLKGVRLLIERYMKEPTTERKKIILNLLHIIYKFIILARSANDDQKKLYGCFLFRLASCLERTTRQQSRQLKGIGHAQIPKNSAYYSSEETAASRMINQNHGPMIESAFDKNKLKDYTTIYREILVDYYTREIFYSMHIKAASQKANTTVYNNNLMQAAIDEAKKKAEEAQKLAEEAQRLAAEEAKKQTQRRAAEEAQRLVAEEAKKLAQAQKRNAEALQRQAQRLAAEEAKKLAQAQKRNAEALQRQAQRLAADLAEEARRQKQTDEIVRDSPSSSVSTSTNDINIIHEFNDVRTKYNMITQSFYPNNVNDYDVGQDNIELEKPVTPYLYEFVDSLQYVVLPKEIILSAKELSNVLNMYLEYDHLGEQTMNYISENVNYMNDCIKIYYNILLCDDDNLITNATAQFNEIRKKLVKIVSNYLRNNAKNSDGDNLMRDLNGKIVSFKESSSSTDYTSCQRCDLMDIDGGASKVKVLGRLRKVYVKKTRKYVKVNGEEVLLEKAYKMEKSAAKNKSSKKSK